MKRPAHLIRKAGTQESRKGVPEIEGKAARVTASEGGSQTSFKSGASTPCFFRFAICVRATDYRMVANDEARMSNNEGMTKIRMLNLRKSGQSVDYHLRDLCVLLAKNNFAP
jgi:hypothetical protein